MSTRAIIRIEGEKAMLYRHSSGSPEIVVPELTKHLNRFKAARGFFEGDLLLACLAHWFKHDQAEEIQAFALPDTRLDEMNVLGYRVCTAMPFDIEYIYTVRKDWAIEVRGTTKAFWSAPSMKNTCEIAGAR